MKMIRRLLFLLLLVGVLGYGAYHFGMEFISNQAADTVTEKLDSVETTAEIRETAQTIPEVQSLLDEGANVNQENLPFTTKEEATKVLIEKVGLSEMKDMYSEYQNGMSEDDIQEVISTFEHKLTDEEMLALKSIAYQELNP